MFPRYKGEETLALIFFFFAIICKKARNADKTSAGRARVFYIANFDINDNKLASQTFPANTRAGPADSLRSRHPWLLDRSVATLFHLCNSMHVIPSSFSEWRFCTRNAPSSKTGARTRRRTRRKFTESLRSRAYPRREAKTKSRVVGRPTRT